MSDVNEELVRRYFELKGYFVRTNVRYEFRTAKGMGHSDVDLCVLNPVTDHAATVEVKGWHTERISPSYLHDQASMFFFVRPEARAAAAVLFGRNDFDQILVVSRLAARGRDQVLEYAREKRVTILEFPDVLQFLISETPMGRSAGSEGEHVIRLMKIYGLAAAATDPVKTPAVRSAAVRRGS